MSDPRRKRKGLLRRPAVQAELELPPPPHDAGAAGFAAHEPQWWQQRSVVIALACAAVLLFVLAIAARVAAHRDQALAARLQDQVRVLSLRAASQVRAVRVTPNPRSWSAAPDATLPWLEPPELLELHLPVAYSEFRVFAITVDKVDAGRVLDLQRVSVDSNRELRLTLNSSAFGPGEYRLRLQGYTWQGRRVDAGWVRLVIGDMPNFR